MDEATAIGLALTGYILAVGLMLALAWYLGQTETLAGRIPTSVLVLLMLLGPLGLVGLVILWFRFRQGRLLAEPPPP